MPLISVVIPLYNKEPHIKRAIDSVLAQKIQDFELIIVDDGSTDKSAEIVKSINDERIKLIQQENAGVSAARNRGISEAQSEMIAFLDADDEWYPEFLETIMRLKSLYPHAGIYGTAYEVDFPGSIEKRVFDKNKGERILSSYFGSSVDFGHTLFNSSSFAAPKDILVKVGGYPRGVKWNEDGTLWFKIALKYPIAYSPEICSIYHQYSSSNSTKIKDYLENPIMQYLSTIPKEELLKRKDAEYLREYLDLSRLSTISRNIYSGYGLKARKELSYLSTPKFKNKRNQLLIMTYVPPYIIEEIHKHAKILSILKRKVFKKQIFN